VLGALLDAALLTAFSGGVVYLIATPNTLVP